MTDCHILPFYTAKSGNKDELPALDLTNHEMIFRGTLLVRTKLQNINAYIDGQKIEEMVLWKPKFAPSVLEKELEVLDERTVMVNTKEKNAIARCRDLREVFKASKKRRDI
ncbi:hypothetical protein THOM_0210 [Trachipleistophora hominis]|uniref:Uncharacterized protein n=1 Tax=Trachipleistophora hominis TaxID=72359 RepID=L7K081_TRAHO|nr:hypothetical protein THOM_0210 [Trachipleistophora hominis]